MNKGLIDRGFSLLEILVAMALVSFMLFFVAGTDFSNRKSLDQTLDKFERIIRYSADESVLRNAYIRLNYTFDSEGESSGIKLEYSDDKDFIIDLKLEELISENNERELEENQERIKERNNSFSQIDEFDAEEFEIPPNVQVIGASSELSPKLVTENSIQVYFYPNGQKDSSIFIFATDEEVAYIIIEPFQQVIKRGYKLIPEDTTEEGYADAISSLAEEVYKEWKQ